MLAVASQTWAAWVIVAFATLFALMLAVGGLTQWFRRRGEAKENNSDTQVSEEAEQDEPKLNG